MKLILSKLSLPLIWVFILAVIVTGYMRISNLGLQLEMEQKERITLQQELTSVKDLYESSVAKITSDLNEQRQITSSLNQRYQSNAEEINRLSSMFSHSSSGNKRDLEEIAEARPTLLQGRLNNATAEVGKRIEDATIHNRNISTGAD